MKHLKTIFACLLMAVLSIGQVWATDYELMLTLDVTQGAPSGSTSTGLTNETLLSYLQGAAPATTDIISASLTGNVYKGKGSGGAGVPQECLKIGKASGAGSITFAIANTYDNVTKVEITGYGWKTSTAVSVNSSDAQSPATALSEVTFSYEISGSKSITINSASSAFCATAIKLYRTSTGGTPSPSLSVDPTIIDFGTVEPGASVANQAVEVTFANLTGSVTYSGLTNPFSASGAISATGDEITISADATNAGTFQQTLTIQSAADSKSVEVTVKMKVAAPTGTFELFTEGLVEGDYVICSGTTALKNELASNTNYIGYETVTVSENKITNPSDALIWHIAQSGEYWTLYNAAADNYAASTGAKNKGQVIADGTDDKALWTTSGTYEFANKDRAAGSDPNNKWLRYNNGYGFACYGTGTGSALTLYKLSNGKETAGLAYDAADAQKLVKVGGTLVAPTLTNPNSLAVTYASNNTSIAEVNETTGAVTIKSAAGVAVITASTVGDATHNPGSASYTIFVATEAGTAEDPLTETSAKALIDLGCTLSAYVKGTVANVGDLNTTYGSITLTLTDGLKFFGMLNTGGTQFETNPFVVGDDVTAVGNLKKYNSTYELDTNCELVERIPAAVVLESISINGTATALEYTDGQHFDPAGLGVTGHYSDASTAPITEGVVWAFDPDPLTEGTESVSVTATASGKTSAAFVVNDLTVGPAAPLSPWATVYTSNITLSTEGGTSASAAKVKFYGEEGDGYDAIKAGTGSAQGAVVVNVPAGATALHLHAYGWKGEALTLSITAPAGVTVTPSSITLNSNDGITSNSPFTLTEGSTPQTDAYYALTLSGNTAAADLTFTATSGKRFVLFGVNQEGALTLESISVSGTATELEYNEGDHFDPTGLVVTGHYSDDSEATISEGIDWTFDPDPLTEGTESVSVTATASGKTSPAFVVNGLTVSGAAPLSPWATVYTSNVELSGSQNVKVTITVDEEDKNFDGVKMNKAAAATFTIPAGTTNLYAHMAAWNGEAQTVTVSGDCFDADKSIDIVADANISGSGTTYDIDDAKAPTDYFKEIVLDKEVTEPTEITITAASGKRFVLFGVNQEGGVLPVLKSIEISGDLTNKSGYKVGDDLDLDGLTVSAIYTLNEVDQAPIDVTSLVNWSYDPLVEGQTSVTITATLEDKSDDITISDLEAVASADPKIYVSTLNVDFGSVEVGEAVPANETVTVTLTNVAAATATLDGEGFSISPSTLTASGDITVSVVASTASAANYSATLTISDDATENPADSKVITLSFAVTEPVVNEEYELVSDVNTLAAGDQIIIVAENAGTYYTLDGSITSQYFPSTAVSISAGIITAPSTSAIILGKDEDNWTMSMGGQLIGATAAKKASLGNTTTATNTWTIAIAENVATITNTTTTYGSLQFNYNGGSNSRFLNYTSAQTAVAIYKKVAPEPPTPATPDYTRDVTNGHYGTICLPKAGTIEGATLYEIGSFESNMIYVDEVGTTLAAGVPYIFYASEAQLNVYYTDKTADDVPADDANGLFGFYNLNDEDATYDIPEDAGNYILYNDQYWLVSGRAAYIANYRAYIKIGSIVPKAPAPGRRRVAMAVNGTQTTTDCELINAAEAPAKMLINGQLFILRGEKMYNVNGQIVK
jgi:hypothetical protein